MTAPRFTRDRSRPLVAGVVAGLQRAHLPQVDLTVLRVLVFVLMLGTVPLSLLAYGLLAVLTPAE